MLHLHLKPDATVKALKFAIEDQEGWSRDCMSIRTVGGTTLEDDQKLQALGFCDEGSHDALLLFRTDLKEELSAIREAHQRCSWG